MKDQNEDPLATARETLKKELYKEYDTVELFCWDKGLNKATISNFLNNKKDFQISTLVQIANALEKKLIVRFD